MYTISDWTDMCSWSYLLFCVLANEMVLVFGWVVGCGDLKYITFVLTKFHTPLFLPSG